MKDKFEEGSTGKRPLAFAQLDTKPEAASQARPKDQESGPGLARRASYAEGRDFKDRADRPLAEVLRMLSLSCLQNDDNLQSRLQTQVKSRSCSHRRQPVRQLKTQALAMARAPPRASPL